MNDVVENKVVDSTPVIVSQDSKNIALLIWIGTFFFGFIPSLLCYLLKKDDDFLTAHSKEALNWSITVCIGYVIAFALTIVLIGLLLIPLVALCHLIFCILGAVKASRGEEYLAPFALRLIK